MAGRMQVTALGGSWSEGVAGSRDGDLKKVLAQGEDLGWGNPAHRGMGRGSCFKGNFSLGGGRCLAEGG